MFKNKNLENKKSDNIYFGNSVDGNRIFPSLRFWWYQKILGRFSESKVLEAFRRSRPVTTS
jgi:hypothetical protein